MDIDIQTILQQDIDLGIKKNVNYEYERVDSSSATASSVGYELFNKYIGNNGGTGASNENSGLAAGGAVGNLFLKPPQFDASESLKNQDILNVENFFASEAIPDGYKLVVEEDTGEWFMIMMRNDSANHSGSQQQVDETSNGFQLGQNESNVDIAFADLYLQEEEAQQLQQQQQQQSARVNQLEQYETSTSPTVRTFKRVEFLSQMSVNNELGKLSLHVEEPSLDPSAAAASAVVSDAVTSNISSSSSVNNATSLISALDDSLTSIEPNLLDEDWINNFLSGGLTSPLSASGEPQQQQLLQQQQITNVSAVVSSSIDNDAMLSTLNANNSIILNDAASTPSHRNQTSLFVGANGVANTTIEFELNTESLELLFNSSLLDSLVDPRSTGGAAIAVSSNMSSLVTTNGTDKLAECVDQFDVFFSNSNIPIKMNDESTTNNGVELTNAFDGKEKMVAKQETTTELFRQQSSLIDSTFIKEEAVEQEDIYGIEANNGALPQTLYVDMSSASAAPATSRVTNEAALAGLYHNHTYMGAGSSSSSSSSAGNEMAFENAVADPSIELHPYSYKSKMLKRIQKTRMMNIKDENGSRANQSRDEQALRDASIELSIEDVVDSSADDFNELIRAHDFTSDQVNLLKDIRRRGKNKVAAQICRKRKLDSIDSLRDKVDELKSLKSELISEYNAIHDEIKQMTFKFDSLYKDAVGANNYDQNDPIVGFINNLKVLNANPTAASAVASSSASASARDRKKTYSSINSSDFDSSLSSMSGPSSHMSTFSELDDYDEEDEEDEDEDADLYDEDEDDEDEGVDEDDDQVVEAVRSSRRASSSSKKAAAAAAAATATMAAVNKNKKMRKN